MYFTPHRLQLQILLVLFLLRLSTQAPVVAARSQIASEGANKASSSPQKAPLLATQSDVDGHTSVASGTTKRKRKAEHAKRWTGAGLAGFPWNLQGPSSREGQVLETERVGEAEGSDDRCTDAEGLSKRFESLLDSLCLQVLTSNLDVDLEHPSAADQSPTPRKKPVRERLQPWQLFGSEGRQRQQDKDVLQWLCCHIIEPQFSRSLPRQCGIIRGKCFVPGSGSTPAKPSRKEKHRQTRRREESARPSIRLEDRGGLSRRASQPPAPVPWSLLREEEEKGRRQLPHNLADRWETRMVSVRRKWDRSQSTGAGPSSAAAAPAPRPHPLERSSSVQPGRPSSALGKREGSCGLRTESQTLVADTPSKGQAYGVGATSSSFSQSHAAAALATWRRTESQPVLEAWDDLSDGDEDQENDWPRCASPPRLESVRTAALHCSEDKHDDDDENAAVMLAKRRRILPPSINFALMQPDVPPSNGRNPFAVAN